jgi:tetratricopeptide (TPR) repeat protein
MRMGVMDNCVKAYVQSSAGVPLRNEISEFWQSLRGQKVYAGQPRNSESDQTIARASMALKVASQSGDRMMLAEASRLMAHALNTAEKYEQSIEHYQRSIELFERLEAGELAARTRLGLMAALFMIGRYDESLEVATLATQWFQLNNHLQGLAKVAANTGNLYFRREEHKIALQHHGRARQLFEKLEDWNGLALTYVNLGNCYSFTEQYAEAEDMYVLAEGLTGRLGMQQLLMQARYNRSYLMFLRGRSQEALASFSFVRQYFKKTSSDLFVSLCDLDVAEIYLHLRQPEEAYTLARNAAAGFERLGMAYEQAKALAFYCMALTQMDRNDEAENAAALSRSLFEREGNRYWVSVLDFCLATEARHLIMQAELCFDDLKLGTSMVDNLKNLGSIALRLARNKRR